MKFDYGIRADYLITAENENLQVVRNQFIGIMKDQIAHVGPFRLTYQKNCKKFIYRPNHVWMPGFVNGHTHLAMTLFRGLEDDVPFQTWLFQRILPLEARLVNKEFVRTGTELAALECIRFGVTSISDMYFYVDETAAVLHKAGIRAKLTQAFMDFEIPEDKDSKLDRWGRLDFLFKKYKDHPRIQIGLGPHAPYTCSNELLEQVKDKAKALDTFIHIHVSETKFEVDESRTKHGGSPVDRLNKIGVLGKKTQCAHCVHLDDADITVFQASGAAVVYNPDSNLKLSAGVAPVPKYLKAKIPVAMGTDGSASNNDLSMFGAMDLGTKVQKLWNNENTAMTARQALYLATRGGALALGLGHTGAIVQGLQADLISVDFDFPHLQPIHDPISHLVYCAQGLEVDTVICAGKMLMENKKIKTLDSAAIFAKVEKQRKKIQAQLDLILKPSEHSPFPK